MRRVPEISLEYEIYLYPFHFSVCLIYVCTCEHISQHGVSTYSFYDVCHPSSLHICNKSALDKQILLAFGIRTISKIQTYFKDLSQ
jgi:hypothetical protein